MRKPDWWNWPPLMTVVRHNREITTMAKNFQEAVDNEYARATRDGRAKVRAWAVEACSNVFHTASPASAAQAAFQQAASIFAPDPVNIKEVLADATVRP